MFLKNLKTATYFYGIVTSFGKVFLFFKYFFNLWNEI